MNRLIIILIISFVSSIVHAQITINGQVLTPNGVEELATISLLRLQDSSIVKTELTDKNEKFKIEKIFSEKYFVTVEVVGFQK